MRVLWVTNIVFPDALDGSKSSLGGGWMTSLLDLIKDEVQLGVVSRYSCSFNKEVNGVEYYLLRDWRKEICHVLESFKPDIIHLHGSEYEHSLIVKEMAIGIPKEQFADVVTGLMSTLNQMESDSNKEIIEKKLKNKNIPFEIRYGYNYYMDC